MTTSDMFLSLGRFSPFRYTAVRCGHRTSRTGQVTAFGETTVMKMPKNQFGSVDYCLDCIGKMTIRCAWCNDLIFIGNPITLYTPNTTQDEFKVPEHAVVYRTDPLQLVGCLGWNCAETGADRAGFWLPGDGGKGRVQRVPTALEAIMGAATPSMLIVNDTHDIAEAVNPTLIPLKK